MFILPMLLVVCAGIISVLTGVATPLLEILVGIFGLNVLGIESTLIIDFLGEVGIISLMYLAGLEVNLRFIKKEYRSSLSIGAASFFAPFIIMTLFSMLALDLTFMQSLLIGVACSTTSVAIVYPILLAKGKLNHSSRTLLAAAMITDLFSIIALSIFFSELSWYTAFVVGGLIVIAAPLSRLGHYMFDKLERGSSLGMQLKLVLLGLLAIQAVASLAGIEAVVLAFLWGVFTSELIERFEVIEKQLKAVTFALLTPFFFFKVGLAIDIPSLMHSLGYLIAIASLTYIVKFSGAYFTTKLFIPKRARFTGHLFNSALSIGIIAATLGFETGLLTKELYIALIGSIILRSFVSSVMVHEKFNLEG